MKANFRMFPLLVLIILTSSCQVGHKYYNNDTIYNSSISGIKSAGVYMLEWGLMRKFAIGMNQIKEFHEHYFTLRGMELDNMFDDYDDCVEKLSSGDSLPFVEQTLLNSLVEIRFRNNRVVQIYFDIQGNYSFDNVWYRRHDDLYYTLFKYFSNVMVPEKVLNEASQNYTGGFWEDQKKAMLQNKVDNLKNITQMLYICHDTIGSEGCGEPAFWSAVMGKLDIVPLLLEKLDDTTRTNASVPNFGGVYTVADIAYIAMQEIIDGIPTFELLGVPFDTNGCGYCAYWNHLRQNYQNRQDFKAEVTKWFNDNKSDLVWVSSDKVLTCDCSFSHPNGGHYEYRQ